MTFLSHIHHLLLDHCTLCEDDAARSQSQRQLYLKGVTRILNASRLAQRTDEQIWRLGWDKPFFAYNTAATVGPAVERARAAGVFADRDVVTSPQFMTGMVPGPLVENAVASGQLIGVCAVPFRLTRVQAFARAVPRISQAVNRFHDDWQTAVLGDDELQERAVAIAEDIGVGGGPVGKVDGFGFTTACHLLADLGLPVFKPDIWVCRIVSSLPGVRAEISRVWQLAEDAPMPFDFLQSKLVGARAPDAYRRIVQPVMNALVEDAQAHGVAEFDLEPAFLRTRFVDWTLVHFAISAETEVFGLKRRPIDVLRVAGEPSATVYLKALAIWLDAGRASYEAVTALKNAEAKVRRAKSPDQRERALQRLARLRMPAEQTKRDELAMQAHRARTAHEAAVAVADWTFAPRYPEGFARRKPGGAWAYKRAALAQREQHKAMDEPEAEGAARVLD